jgi:hypothetical protein
VEVHDSSASSDTSQSTFSSITSGPPPCTSSPLPHPAGPAPWPRSLFDCPHGCFSPHHGLRSACSVHSPLAPPHHHPFPPSPGLYSSYSEDTDF